MGQFKTLKNHLNLKNYYYYSIQIKHGDYFHLKCYYTKKGKHIAHNKYYTLQKNLRHYFWAKKLTC